LIRAKRINTTVAKAKALRVYAEPIINRAKEDTTNSRRIVFSYLQDKEAVKELFGDIAVKIANRPGGYLRILKLGQNRLGDNAEMAMIEFVDYNENLLKDNVEKKSKTRRSRSKKAAEAAPAAEPEAKAE
jgi:large subunit ribosomal protein L17